MKTEKLQHLYFDQDSFNYSKDNEIKLFTLFDEIKAQAVSTLGEYKINYIDLLADPVNYLVTTYWNEFANRPKHVQKNMESICVSDTSLNIPLLKQNVTNFKRSLSSMGKYAPLLNKSGLKSTITKDQFNRNLDPEKANHYKAIKDLYEASREVKKYSPLSIDAHILRFCEGFQMDLGELKINYSLFQM